MGRSQSRNLEGPCGPSRGVERARLRGQRSDSRNEGENALDAVDSVVVGRLAACLPPSQTYQLHYQKDALRSSGEGMAE